MTDYNNKNQQKAPNAYANVPPRGNETALMIEGLYNGLAYDLQKMKKELMNELKYSAMQSSAVYESIQKETNNATEKNSRTAQSMVNELKFGYQQNQMIYESLSGILSDDVVSRIDTVEGKLELLENIDKSLAEIQEKLNALAEKPEPDYESITEEIRNKVVEAIPQQEEIDYDKITESVMEKAEASLVLKNKEVLDAVAAIPVAENVDYMRIVEEVGERVIDKINEAKAIEAAEKENVEDKPVKADIDYDRIIYGAAEKVVESLPFNEKVDYNRINDEFNKAATAIKPEAINEETFAQNVANAVTDAVSKLDINDLAQAVSEKIVLPEFDYAHLADMVIERITMPEPAAIDYDVLAEKVIEKMPVQPEPEAIDYDLLAEKIVEKTAEANKVEEDVEEVSDVDNVEVVEEEKELVDYDVLADKIIEKMPVPETVDYDFIADKIIERLPVPDVPEAFDYDKINEIISTRDEEMSNSLVEKLPVPEALDYVAIAQTVVDRLPATEIPEIDYDRVCQAAQAAQVVPDPVDYDRIAELVEQKIADKEIDIDALATKVVERMEAPDYDIIVSEEGIGQIANNVVEVMDYDNLATKVAEKVTVPEPEAIDYDGLAAKVAEKVVIPEIVIPEPEAIDYDGLSDKVAEKVVIPEIVVPEPEAIDYDGLAAKVAEKVVIPEKDNSTYDVVVDDEGAKSIADRVAEVIDVDAVADKVAEKIVVPTPEIVIPEPEKVDYSDVADKVIEKYIAELPETVNVDSNVIADDVAKKIKLSSFDMIIDEEGAERIAQSVVEKLRLMNIVTVSNGNVAETSNVVETKVVETEEAKNENNNDDVMDFDINIDVDEDVETEEQPVEEPIEEPQSTVEDEVAVTDSRASFDEIENNLVDADTGLVLRLKRSFTAKMKQSEPIVKQYYSDVKNKLTSYKRLNSNISWHGDRFNYGRETVAKLNICGKTLCFYLALDPTNPEYKTTVYHQKDVSAQKAYEHTPFLVKIKSDAALKKAIRLAGFLADKLGAEEDKKFEPVDYTKDFCHATTKQLLEDGQIRVTKEKKVVLDFN